ncbi:MAG TPA: nicotinamide-nucleotide amidohydrolase family protein [Methanomassiliicoccales archaeon]|nr:nicotinamide-nucleotide amidohydrolase family protein [Methanomassiliicoccales archaeon]
MPEIELLTALRQKRLTIAVAESCTGGRICDKLTNVPGSSDVFLGGVVAYSNDSKVKLLGVSLEVLGTYGAVSSVCAAEMAAGVRKAFGADVGISVTGIAGPGGASETKPVGLVFIGLDYKGKRETFRIDNDGDRERIKEEASDLALKLALDLMLSSDL